MKCELIEEKRGATVVREQRKELEQEMRGAENRGNRTPKPGGIFFPHHPSRSEGEGGWGSHYRKPDHKGFDTEADN